MTRRPVWAGQVEKLADAVAQRYGLALAGLDVLGEGPRTIVRISVEYLDREVGVSVDDCALVAEELGRALDLHDPIPHAYTLEVASPGLDRPLRSEADYRRFAGRKVEVTTHRPIHGRRRWKGRLLGLEQDRVVLEVEAQAVHLPLADVARAHLAVDMDDLREDFLKGGA
ncbi:MAG: ribosome maturation factor RimP [Armatimonadota bacterium]|nr:ribosome maturation factor RimP [Armatimonadota bacterium]MDR7518208.1 ribosome maturation factor RimP [Armatimonadota bacterium]